MKLENGTFWVCLLEINTKLQQNLRSCVQNFGEVDIVTTLNTGYVIVSCLRTVLL
jgi:hypothetical protein